MSPAALPGSPDRIIGLQDKTLLGGLVFSDSSSSESSSEGKVGEVHCLWLIRFQPFNESEPDPTLCQSPGYNSDWKGDEQLDC